MDNIKEDKLGAGDEITVRSALVDAANFPAVPRKQPDLARLGAGQGMLKPRKGKVWLQYVCLNGVAVDSSLHGLTIHPHLMLYKYVEQKTTDITKITHYVVLEKEENGNHKGI